MRNNRAMLRICLRLLALGSAFWLPAAAQENAAPTAAPPKPMTYVAPTKENYLKFASEAETMLHRDVLDVWFPRAVDNVNGGFRSDFTRDWQPGAKSGGKFSVSQGRMTWVAAQIVMRRPELKAQYLPYVRHGDDLLDGHGIDLQGTLRAAELAS